MLFKIVVDKKPESCKKCIFFEEKLDIPRKEGEVTFCNIVEDCRFSQPDLPFTIENCPLSETLVEDGSDDTIFNVSDELFKEDR